MKRFLLIKYGIFCLALTMIFGTAGCEAFNEALQAELEYGSSESGSSDDFKPRFVMTVCAIVKYPRAQMLELQVDCNGTEIWINRNQLFDSKRIEKARAVPRPGNPDVCDLEFKLDPLGKTHWQMLVASAGGNEVALLVDQRCVATFVPEMPNVDSDRIDWVKVRAGVDAYTARGIVRYAHKNHVHFNPDAGNFFRFL
ncbi:MAG: hypothetical protein E7054_02360 [Lentisphaerae bacterium]|nr:hypothetical protein [Lentisphaerota bacterium]